MFLGLDIGTQGARVVVCDESGKIICSFEQGFHILNTADRPGYIEQHPEEWWNAACMVIRKAVKVSGARNIRCMSLDATSGTILPLDKCNRPLTNGIMYNDSRSVGQVGDILALAGTHQKEHGYVFNSSYALPKILWIRDNLKHVWENTARFAHQADYITGKLTGNYEISDYSNSLKTGCDLIRGKWPDFIEALGISPSLLPRLTTTGYRVGNISPEAAVDTGLLAGTALYAGATDGFASSLAAGLAVPGDWSSVIGTTLVIKGITSELRKDGQGRIYSHRHPQGWWMPGGASNTGGRALNDMFGEDNFEAYNKKVNELTPTGLLYYPLTVKGERFPFVAPDAESFYIGSADEPARYAGVMEGIGYIERLAYELLESLGCETGDTLLASGGACKSAGWLQIRANILGKCVKVPQVTGAAMGSAIIAAADHFGGLSKAVKNLVSMRSAVEPEMPKHERYNELYQEFKRICTEKGWIK